MGQLPGVNCPGSNYPGDNCPGGNSPRTDKENVPLAPAVIHETMITEARSYFPNRRDVAKFLEMFNTWWTISNSKKRFSPNILGML